jgi:hypothetical protein
MARSILRRITARFGGVESRCANARWAIAVIWFSSWSSVLGGACTLRNNLGSVKIRSRTTPLASRQA